jgi:hypothetical protein
VWGGGGECGGCGCIHTIYRAPLQLLLCAHTDLRIDAHILFLHVHIHRALLHIYRAILHIYRALLHMHRALLQQGSFASIFALRSAIVSVYASSILYIGLYVRI